MRNNYSIGIDIVEVNRVDRLSSSYGHKFYKHVFTENEVQWCCKKSIPPIHLAGKYAAKEAVKKALMAIGETNIIPMNAIEIIRRHGQAPWADILCPLSQSYKISISISHTEKLATAIALVQLK